MSDKQRSIDCSCWDNLAWGEVGCHGGGVLRGAPTPRIDSPAADGLKLLHFNVEAQVIGTVCVPERNGWRPVKHADRLGVHSGGPDELTRWEVTLAQALSDAGYATGM